MAVDTYTKTGNKASSSATLPKSVFGLEVKDHQLLQQAVETYRANGRSVYAQSKDRSEVRGGGRKPWRQKGTGRARHGSIRSPIWRGGGVTFGPRGNQSYEKSLNKKAKRLAIKQALSLAAQNGTVKVVADIDFKDGKTKQAAEFFKKLGCERRTVLVVESLSDEVKRAVKNLPHVEVVQAQYLNVYTILSAHHLVLTKAGIDVIENWLDNASESKRGGKK